MYKKIKLDYNSLEPTIDNETLDIHYNKHYEKYVDNLNKLVGDISYSLVDILKHIDDFDSDIQNLVLFNAGGVLNHQMYFENMAPATSISDNFKGILADKYGSYEQFVNEFKKSANSLQGSGYTFLVLCNGQLDIINLPNQENPYLYNMVPLLVLDLWEHAYYLQYKNNRGQYIDNFFSIINFDKVEERYEKAQTQNKNLSQG